MLTFRHLIPAIALILPVAAQAQEMPAHVSDIVGKLALTDVQWHPGAHRADAEGRLGSAWVELDFDRSGALDEIEAEHGGLFPASAIAAVVPQPLLDNVQYPADAEFSKIEFNRDKIEIDGRTAAGVWFEAEFSPRGEMLKWDRED